MTDFIESFADTIWRFVTGPFRLLWLVFQVLWDVTWAVLILFVLLMAWGLS